MRAALVYLLLKTVRVYRKTAYGPNRHLQVAEADHYEFEIQQAQRRWNELAAQPAAVNFATARPSDSTQG